MYKETWGQALPDRMTFERHNELFLHRSRVTQESCETEMTHYAKKCVVDYCSTCGVAHIHDTTTSAKREYLREKRVGVGR